jgi:hypothetical protein
MQGLCVMNIKNPNLQYSKLTSSLRDPGRTIADQQHKLVFIYPMIVDNSLRIYQDLIRDFVSVNILKEIFVSNAINMVSQASQIYPVTDERGQETDVARITGEIEHGTNGYGGLFGRGNKTLTTRRNIDKTEIQNQVKRKTEVIRKILLNDPAYKSLKPHIELITMDNMIDVPIIVGTKAYGIDSLVSTMMMVVCVSENGKYTLRDQSHVNQIFQKIKTTNEEDAWQLLNNLSNRPKKERGTVITWFLKRIDRSSQSIKNIGKRTKNSIGGRISNFITKKIAPDTLNRTKTQYNLAVTSVKDVHQRITNVKADPFTPDESFAILNTVSDNLDQAELFFKFALDKKLLYGMHGVDNEKIDMTSTRIAGPFVDILNNFHSRFIKTISVYGIQVIQSLINMLYPLGYNVDTTALIRDKLDDFENELHGYLMEDLKTVLEKMIADDEGAERSKDKIERIKNLCSGDFSDSDDLARSLIEMLNEPSDYLNNPGFSYDDLTTYLSKLDKIYAKASVNTSRFERVFAKLVEKEHLLTTVHKMIATLFNKIAAELQGSYMPDMSNVSIVSTYRGSGVLGVPQINTIGDLNHYVNDNILSASVSYIYFLFMWQLQVSLCEFVEVVHTHLEVATESVLDFPNYVFVIPVEICIAIANAIVARSWKDITHNPGEGRQLAKALNDNYVKEIVKYISKKIKVPNLIVIDSKRGDVYYKMMYNSKPQKVKLKSLQTYIDTIKDQTLTLKNDTYY